MYLCSVGGKNNNHKINAEYYCAVTEAKNVIAIECF